MCVTYYTVATTEKNGTIMMPPQDCNIGPPANRVDCSYSGGGKPVCDQRECCWDSSVGGVTWCFYGNDVITRQTNIYINSILQVSAGFAFVIATVIFD